MSQKQSNLPPTKAKLLKEAHRLIDLGFVLTPAFKRGTKGPNDKGWNTAAEWVDSHDKVDQMFAIMSYRNFGVILEPSGLVSFDVDEYEQTKRCLDLVHLDLEEILDSGIKVQGNPNGHAKALYRIPDGMELELYKLNFKRPLKERENNRETIFELRAGTVQDVMPPSIHPEGVPYKWLTTFETREDIPELPAELVQLWEEFKELEPEFKKINPWADESPPVTKTNTSTSSGSAKDVYRKIREALPVTEYLEKQGLEPQGKKYLCPFHDENEPSFWVWTDDDDLQKWTCAHGGAPVGGSKNGQSHGDVVDLYQFFEGKKSLKQATKALAEEFGISVSESSGDDRESQANMLTKEFFETAVELWHTPDEVAFVTVSVGDSIEHLEVRKIGFARFLRAFFYGKHKVGLSDAAHKQAVLTIEAECVCGEVHETSYRVGAFGGNLFYDLANDVHEIVRITSSGWEVVNATEVPEVRFVRAKTMQPQVTPKHGGNTKWFFRLLNLEDKDDRVLVCSWIVSAMVPHGPFPIGVLNGQHGSGKSTQAALYRAIIDPSSSATRSMPTNSRDLVPAVQNSWLQNFDNVSHIQPWLSDTLCRVSTGGGIGTRELFTNAEEILVDVQRPVLLNGIPALGNRADLLDRMLKIQLAPIPAKKRLSEEKYWGRVENVLPEILGAFFSAMSTGLKKLPDLTITNLPRMADFAKWATACEEGFGFEEGTFLEAYSRARDESELEHIENDEVAEAIVDFCECCTQPLCWSGQAKDLKTELEEFKKEQSPSWTVPKYWPSSGQGMSSKLRRMVPVLRAVGLELTPPKRRAAQGKRPWFIERCKAQVSETSVVSYSSNATDVTKTSKTGKLGDVGDVLKKNVTGNVTPLNSLPPTITCSGDIGDILPVLPDFEEKGESDGERAQQ